MTSTQKGLIGAIMLNCTRVMPLCVTRGMTSAWFDGDCAAVYRIITTQWAETGVTDLLSVSREIERQTLRFSIHELESAVDGAIASHTPYYIDTIEADYLLSLAKTTAQDHADRLETLNAEDVSETIDLFRDEWAKIKLPPKDEQTLKEDADSLIEEWSQPVDEQEVIHWPTRKMQDNIGWLSDELVYIAARESVGKTTLALQMAVTNGFKSIPGAFASLESKQRKLVQRMIAMVGKVDVLRMRLRKASTLEFERAREASVKIDALPIAVGDHGMSIAQLRAFAELEIGRGAKYLIVDNMKHIRPERKYNSTVEQFRETSAQLKWLRDDLGIPVIVLHHLNKDMDLSWSDDIRRDADVIMFLSEDEEQRIIPCRDNNWIGRDIVIVDVIKNREGRKNFSMSMDFSKRIQTFSDFDSNSETEGGDPL